VNADREGMEFLVASWHGSAIWITYPES